MVKPARVPKQNKPKKNSTNISAEENALIEEKIEALRSEVDSIQGRSKIFENIVLKMLWSRLILEMWTLFDQIVWLTTDSRLSV